MSNLVHYLVVYYEMILGAIIFNDLGRDLEGDLQDKLGRDLESDFVCDMERYLGCKVI